MTDTELAAIRERCESATEGPWEKITERWLGIWQDIRVVAFDGKYIICGDTLIADAEFIAAARSDVPALLDEVDRLRGLLGEAYEELDTHSAGCRLCDGYGDPCTCGLPDLRRRIEVEIAKKDGGLGEYTYTTRGTR